LPRTPVQLTVAAVLFVFGTLLVFKRGDDDDETPGVAGLDTSSLFFRIASLAFITIGVAELGDFTQLTTATLSARFGAPLEVGLGAFSAESACAALGVTVGGTIAKRVPTELLQRVAGGLFIVLATVTLVLVVRR